MSTRLEILVQQRLEKLEKIRASGIDPYPHLYQRTHTAQQVVALLKQDGPPREVKVSGRITASRPMGKAAFMNLSDGSGKIQVYVRRDHLGEQGYDLFKLLDLGDFIGLTGRPFYTHTGEPTIEAASLTVLSKALLPLPEKWHGLTDVEKRYRQRYLDLVSSDEVKGIFHTRSRIIASMRRFLDDLGFMEVETPILQSHAGGAMAKPFTTHHNVLDRDLYLRIATELHLKRLLVGGFEKVYEIGRIFRNEGISTKHNPEFTSMESYEAYADYTAVMSRVEEMVAHIARSVLGTTTVEYDGRQIDFTPPWRRITLRDAIKEQCDIDFAEFPDAPSLAAKMKESGMAVEPGLGRGKLIDELLSTAVEHTLTQPTFLLDYPVELSPLAKRKPGEPDLVERFEAFAGGMEIANAFTELNDPVEQRERFKEQAKAREAGDEEAEMPDEDFLVAMEHGMPPAGGLGVGIDRLAMLLTNQQSIREVILFPQLKTRE
ncbi:MAG: lysine--tRNA ligase [Dehalococcoidia bacterium]|nr:lysine--tRNA ligase [Dehalococcoidia bacterium]